MPWRRPRSAPPRERNRSWLRLSRELDTSRTSGLEYEHRFHPRARTYWWVSDEAEFAVRVLERSTEPIAKRWCDPPSSLVPREALGPRDRKASIAGTSGRHRE